MNRYFIAWGVISSLMVLQVFSQICSADFSYSINCQTITFTDQSSPSADIQTWNWIFPGGTPGLFNGKTPPPVVYSSIGEISVTLSITTTNGDCSDTENKQITIPELPTASFTYEVTDCPNEITFTGIVSNNNSFSWDFDFMPSVTNNLSPVVNFPGPGEYEVVFRSIATNPDCEVSFTRTITVYPNLAPEFEIIKDVSHCSGDPIMVTNITTGGSDNNVYQWNMGDGTVYNGFEPPPHVYETYGNGTRNYTIRLSVTNPDNGCNRNITHNVTVLRRPQAHLGGTENSPVDIWNYTIRNCENASTSDPFFDIEVYYNPQITSTNAHYLIESNPGNHIIWDEDYPPTTGTPATFSYTELGVYDLSFTITGSNGCTDTKIYQVLNIGNPAGGLINMGNSSGCTPISFSFPLSGFEENHHLTTYYVDFGDGQTETFNHPPPAVIDHIYNTSSCPTGSGGFIVSMTIQNLCDFTLSTTGPIRVWSAPDPDFNVPDKKGCVGVPLIFENETSSGYGANPPCNQNVEMFWDFGDGTTLGPDFFGFPYPDAEHIYSAPGFYTVSLTSSNSCNEGVAETVDFEVCVENDDPAEFSVISDPAGCAPYVVNVKNISDENSICNVGSYTWNVITPEDFPCDDDPESPAWEFFSGNENSVSPAFRFLKPGEYTIQMTMNNSCVLESIHEEVIVVKGVPVLEDMTGIMGDCAPVTINPAVSFQSCNGNVNPATSFNWLFPGGMPNSSSQQVPGNVVYAADGTYTVSVTAQNECGLSNELSASFGASPGIEDNIITAPAETTICQGQFPGIIIGSVAPELSGGDGNYTFEWQMSTSADFSSPVTAGGNTANLEYTQQLLESVYFRRIVYSGGCINASDPVFFTVIPGILNNVISADQSVCQGDAPAILIGGVPTGGSSEGVYAYQWQRNTVPATIWEDIAGATQKDYQPPALNISRTYRRIVNSVPADDCESISVPVVITVNPIPMITSSTQKFICSGLSVSYIPTSNIPGTTFQWNVVDNSAGCITGIAASSGVGVISHTLVNTCSDIQTVSYFITPVGPTGCTGDESELVVEVNPQLLVTLTPANATPGYGTWTTITASITGGTGNLNINWQGGPITSGLGTTTITTGQLYANTQYEITVTDENNCSATASIILIVGSDQPELSVSADPNPVCPGWESILTASASGGSGSFTYQWFDGDNNPIPNNGESQITVQPAVTTTYTVTANDGFNPVLNETITVEVNTTPQITSPLIWEICSQTQVAYQPVSNVEGTTFEWFSTNNSPDCIDVFGADGEGNIQNTLVNNCLTPQNIIYTVVPTGPEPPTGGCPGIESEITVTVNPFSHIINTPSSQTNISGATPNPTVVVFEADIDQNITYAWSTSGNPNLQNSYPLSGTGDLVFNNPFTIVPSGNETEILEYSVFPVYNGVLIDCPGQEFIYTVIVKQTPSLFQVQGGGVFCDDGINCVDITLSGSQDGVSYQLRRGALNYGAPVPGSTDGSAIIWSCISEPGNYAVVAINQSSGASNLMTGNALVSPKALPETFTIYPLAPGDNCIPVTPWLNGSESDVVYRLNRESQGILFQNIEELIGDGGPLTFSEYTESGIYTITAIRNYPDVSCPLEMNGAIDAIPLPFEFPITPQGTVCEDVEEICITQSEPGVEYQLWLNNQPVAGTLMVGNGGQICFGLMSAPGTYRIRAKNPDTNCEVFFQQTVSVNPAPIKYSVAPVAGCAGTEITLIGCDEGIDYYLFIEPAKQVKQFVEVMGPLSCNANGIVNFGPQFDAGIYSIKAVNPVSNCAVWMDGTTTIYPSPQVFEISPQANNCPPVSIKLDDSEPGVTYFLYRDNIVVTSVEGTGGAINFGTQTLAGVYTIRGLFLHDDDFECWSEMTGSMTIQPTPSVYTLLPQEPVCSPAAFYLNESQTGVTYSLYHNLSGLKQSLPGTGNPLVFASETEPGEYWVEATNQASGNCSSTMSGTRTILPLPALYSILPGDGRWCIDDAFDLGLSGSDIGFTYELHKTTSAGNPQATFAGDGSAFVFSGFDRTVGTWRVKAIDNATGCERWMTGQVIINNPPVAYQVTANGNSPVTSLYCPGTEIGLEFSQAGVNYYLLLPSGETIMVAGTGTAISFGVFYNPGDYTVLGVNPTTTCDTPMQGMVTINISPEVFDLAAVNNIVYYCEGDDTAIELVLGYSTPGVSYQLFNGTTNEAVFGPLPGNGGPLVWNNVSQFGPGEYYVVATFSDDLGCYATMNGVVNIELVVFPSASISGSQSICFGYTADIPVQLSGHANLPLSVTYTANGQLQEPIVFYPGQNWGVLTVSPTESTIYEIVGVEYADFANCDGVIISGSYQVDVQPLPLVDAGGIGSACVNSPYQLDQASASHYSSVVWTVMDGSGYVESSSDLNAFYVPHADDAGQQVTLQITAFGAGSCDSILVQDLFLLDVLPLPEITVGGSLATCVNESIEIPEGHVEVSHGQNIAWQIKDLSGAGTIVNGHLLTPVYLPHASDVGKTVVLEITARGMGACATNLITKPLEIKIGADPVVWFSVVDNQADSTRCQNATVYFKDMVNFGVGQPHPDQAITRRLWEFRNTAGYYETIETVHSTIVGHQFSQPGNFEVTLTIETMIGDTPVCSSSATSFVTIHAAPVADFLTHSLSNCNNMVQFEDMSTTQFNSIISWLWDFGDGYFSTVPDPLYEYTSSGPKTASLTVRDQRGCESDVSKDFMIDESFDFTIGYEPFCFGDETQIAVMPGSVVPEGNTIAGHKWTYSNTSDATFAPIATPVFPQPGRYQVSLEATDITGCVKIKTIAVDVPEPLSPSFSFDDCELTVAFILNQENDNGTVSEWQWDFGDSNTQVYYDIHPDIIYHDYQDTGSYIVTLKVFDAIGCEGEFIATNVRTLCVDNVGFFVPTAFVPDHVDKDVKVFRPKGISIGEYHIRVLDLWGNVVWESTALEDGSPAESWDGTFNNRPMPQGVYVWSAYVRFLDGTVWKGTGEDATTGTVTIIR